VGRLLGWRRTQDALSGAEGAVIAWAGMRGVVSLAAAQALPTAFPQRNLLLVLTFSVILATLVLQGLSLPALIRRLGLSEGGVAAREEAWARLAVTQAALAHLDALATGDQVPPALVDDLRWHYATRAHLLVTQADDGAGERHAHARAHRELQRDLLAVERQTLIELRRRNKINDETLRRIQRDLDLDEVRLEADAR
jgi:CPA1 family monovalent cation:H+ antiporter